MGKHVRWILLGMLLLAIGGYAYVSYQDFNMMGNDILNATWVNGTKHNGTYYGDGSHLSGIIISESDPLWSANYTALNSSWSLIYNSTYDSKPDNTYNATYDSKPSNTYNSTYDAKTNSHLADNEKQYYGTGDDWCIYFDGVSLITSNAC